MRGRTLIYVAVCLGCMGCCKESDIPSASKRLYSTNPRDRNDGALDLARCGARAQSAVPRLIQLLYDDNVGVQSASAYALRQIDTVQARKALEEAARRKQ